MGLGSFTYFLSLVFRYVVDIGNTTAPTPTAYAANKVWTVVLNASGLSSG